MQFRLPYKSRGQLHVGSVIKERLRTEVWNDKNGMICIKNHHMALK